MNKRNFMRETISKLTLNQLTRYLAERSTSPSRTRIKIENHNQQL